MTRLPLSVLDLSPIPSGKTARDALLATLDLAEHVESLGYRRYWVAEHHNAKGVACTAPEIVIGQVAAATSTMRVGSGGIMLPNHASLKVAETFRTLAAFYPDRIDLGVGRAAGTDPRTARVLRRLAPGDAINHPDELPRQLEQLFGYLEEDEPPREPFATSIVAAPGGVPAPPVYLLGSSDFSAALAAQLGLPFAFAHHFAPDGAVTAMRAYKRDFRPSRHLREPYAILAVAALAADSDDEADELALSMKLAAVRFAQGLRDLPLPSIEEARAYRYDETELALAAGQALRGIAGGAPRVARALAALAEATGADELMITTSVHAHDARKRSYALLADALGA
jgi:luciferase family oxidoreductase group 1